MACRPRRCARQARQRSGKELRHGPASADRMGVGEKVTPFHVAVQVRDIDEARVFYRDVIGCAEGRSAATWVDFNLYGHQFVCHLNPLLGKDGRIASRYSPVDGHEVPVPHCGVVLEMDEWERLTARLRGHHVRFVVEPYVRFKGAPGEQATLFVLDPTGNALEFKAFKDIADQLFAT